MSQSLKNGNESLINAALSSACAEERYYDADGIPLTVGNDGQLRVMESLHALMVCADPNPARREGVSHHTELESFIEHVNRMKEKRTTIWADVDRCLFTSIYNYDPAGAEPSEAGWGDHQAKYICPLSPEWKAWTVKQGKWMSQNDFAQWIDSRFEDMTGAPDMPKPIDLLEMSRNLQIFTKGTHTKKVDPTTGQYALVCKEEHTSDSTKIPRAFMTGLRVFEGGEIYGTEIRLQFRMTEGKAMFCFSVHRHEELKRDAFSEMRTTVAAETDRPVFAGRHD